MTNEEIAREIVKKVSDAAIELAFTRHELTTTEYEDADYGVEEGVEAFKELVEDVKKDVLACLTGDDTGCLDPEDIDYDNETIFTRRILDAKDEAATTTELVFEGRLEPDEIRRFQEGIRDHLIHLGVPDSRIDGAGCDSGDPLDFTKAEISQAFGYFEEAATTAQAEARENNGPAMADRVAAHYCSTGSWRPYPSALCSSCREPEHNNITLRGLVSIMNRATKTAAEARRKAFDEATIIVRNEIARCTCSDALQAEIIAALRAAKEQKK